MSVEAVRSAISKVIIAKERELGYCPADSKKLCIKAEDVLTVTDAVGATLDDGEKAELEKFRALVTLTDGGQALVAGALARPKDTPKSAVKVSKTTAPTVKPQPKITIYGAEWCGWCKKAEAHFKGLGVKFEHKDVDDPKVAAELEAEMKKRGDKDSGIPYIIIGNKVIHGFDEKAIAEALKK